MLLLVSVHVITGLSQLPSPLLSSALLSSPHRPPFLPRRLAVFPLLHCIGDVFYE